VEGNGPRPSGPGALAVYATPTTQSSSASPVAKTAKAIPVDLPGDAAAQGRRLVGGVADVQRGPASSRRAVCTETAMRTGSAAIAAPAIACSFIDSGYAAA
jgi:hypothetical protein